jgi:hypothetical protein
MAQSTGIIIAAGSITFVNEWLNNKINWKVPIATAGAALIFAGMEKIPGAQPFVVGIAVIALISVLAGGITPGVPSPAVQILDFINKPNTGKKT